MALAVAPDSPTGLLALARSYGPLRAVDAAQAPVVRAAAEWDRRVLPRWQRGGDGIHETAAPAAYAGTLAWRSREHWLGIVVPAAIKARPEALAGVQGHTPWSVAPDMLASYLRVLSLYAHAGTGRRCIVRPDRLAELLGTTKRTVQRCQKAAEALGLYVIVTPGRMLTATETYAARAHGSRQRGLSNEAALGVPAWLPRASAWAASPRRRLALVTPTSGRARDPENLTVSGSLGSERRYAGGAEPAPPARASDKQGAARRYDPAALDLARDLTQHPALPWLAGVAPGRLETALRRFVSCRLPWTAGDLADAVDVRNKRLGRASMTRGLVKHPPALLASYLRDLDPDADHPRLWLDPDAERHDVAQHRRQQLVAIHRAHPSARGTMPADFRAAYDAHRRSSSPDNHPPAG